MIKSARAKKIGFSLKQAGIITLTPAQIKIPGRHNLANALAAAQVAYLCGIDQQTVATVLKVFPGVEHRIEFVRKLNGVEFYNDSKATNPDSTLVAIETFTGRDLVLILGGRDKGVPLEPLAAKIKQRVKAVVLIGEAAERLAAALQWAGYNKIVKTAASMAEAVKQAYQLAGPEAVVLLSPSCASFDMFKNFEERGQVFKQLCQSLS
jgi:UDP-N-acetylmuramoylalanine--D-glutamate ligase